MPQVWPVIATRGRPDWLLRQLNILLPQLQGAERCVVVVDGDADTTAKLPSDARIVAIPLAVNLGVYHARRIGAAEVPADAVICEIDDHDLAEPELLAELRAAFADPNAMLAYCDVWHADAERRVKLLREKTKPNFRSGGQLGWGMRAYRKWVYDAVGGYPLEFAAAGDYALCARMEALVGDGGLRRIAKPMITVLEHSHGISATRKAEQQDVVERVATQALNGLVKLPFELVEKPEAPAVGPESVGGPLAIAGARASRPPAASDRSDTSDKPAAPAARPRVLLIAQYLGAGRGGGELSLLTLMRRLSERGFDVHAAYGQDADSAAPWSDPWLTPHCLGPGYLGKLRDTLLRVNPCVVVADAAAMSRCASLCRELGYPTVALVQFWRGLIKMEQGAFDAVHAGDVPPELQDADGIAELQQATSIVANSPLTADRARALLGRYTAATVYPPVDASCVAADAPPLDTRDTVVCPSVQTGKGSVTFLDLAERNPGLKFLLLAGDNAHSRENAVVARAKSMPNVIVREDWVRDMASVYAAARVVFVGTTTCETFCRVAAEARANGVPILANDSGHLAAIARTGGVVVRRGASIEEWQAGLDAALALRPEPSSEYLRDDFPKFLDVVCRTRRLAEVAVLKPSAMGVSQGCEQMRRVLGATVVEWPCAPADLASYGLVVMCGFYDAEWAAARKGPLAVWWCSHAAQMDTSRHEVTNLLDVAQAFAGRADRWLAMTSKPDALAWRRVNGLRVAHLPNCTGGLDVTPDFSRAAGRRVFIVGHYDTRKNPYTAVAACALARAEVHVTALARKAPGLLDMAARLGAPVVVHDCPDRASLRAVAAQCNAAVAVSSAETWCYAAAEVVQAGAPCVAWRGIPSLRCSPPELTVSDPSDVADVADRINRALANGFALAKAQWQTLCDNAASANRTARDAMLEMLHV